MERDPGTGNVVGCDVSKDWIDVFEASAAPRRSRRIANQREALHRWAQSLPEGTRVGMEATGTMHELLAHTVAQAGHMVYVLNPRWVHRYAGSVGMRGKTDQGDAQLIARYIQSEQHHLHCWQPPGEPQQALRRLLLRRIELTKLRAATRMSLGEEADMVVRAFTELLKQIERRIATLLKANENWGVMAARLRAIPGVGPLVAAHLVQVLDRFSFRNVEAFIAHTGTDPRPNDSGHKVGRRRLSHHGDGALRQMLFMAALAASKRPEWRVLYERHRAKGLASTAVLVILARKIARIAYAVSKRGFNYDPTRISPVEIR